MHSSAMVMAVVAIAAAVFVGWRSPGDGRPLHMTGLPSVEVATTIVAGSARVWAIVSDIAVLPAFSAELPSVEWVGGRRGPALGASFDGVNTHPAMGTWTTRSTIVAFDPPTQLAWAVGDPDNRAATCASCSPGTTTSPSCGTAW